MGTRMARENVSRGWWGDVSFVVSAGVPVGRLSLSFGPLGA